MSKVSLDDYDNTSECTDHSDSEYEESDNDEKTTQGSTFSRSSFYNRNNFAHLDTDQTRLQTWLGLDEAEIPLT